MDNHSQAGVGDVTINIQPHKPSDTASETIITRATTANLKGVVVLGYDADGQEYIDCNIDDGGEVLWLLHRAIHLLVSSGMPK